MSDLWTTNPTTDNNENTNPIINPDNFDTNLWTISHEENSSDTPNIFSKNENSTENILTSEVSESGQDNQAKGSEIVETTEEIKQSSPIQEFSPTNIPEENFMEQDELPKDLTPSKPEEKESNEIILWKFDNAMLNTIENWKNSSTLDNSILEHPVILDNSPVILDNSPIMKANAEDHEKAKLIQKEKLAQLIKIHETKAKKAWFTKWIFSGVILTIAIIATSFILAKDQILNLLDYEGKNNIPLPASIMDLNHDNKAIYDETIDDETIDDETIGDETIGDETIGDETIDDETIDDETIGDETIDDETIDDETIDDETIGDETIDDETIDDETLNEKNTSEYLYNITHVDSEENANWVLPAHCSDLTCYGEDKEFNPCTTFRLSENLDENANRIGNNWTCRYKDASELVYVEFN